MRGYLPRPKVSKCTKAQKERAACKDLKAKIKYHARKYDVATELFNSLSGLTYGKISRGDSMDAKKELSRLFPDRSGNKVTVLAAQSSGVRHFQNISEVKVYVNEVHALLDSGAVPKILPKSFDDRILVIEEDINKHIAVTNGVKFAVLALLTVVTVALNDFIVPRNFLIF